MTRRVIVSLLVALFAGALGFDALQEQPVPAPPAPEDPAAGEVLPVASPATDLSSTWFCAGGSADAEAFADHVVAILNPTDEALVVTVTAYAGDVAAPPVDAEVEELDPDAEPTPEQEGNDESQDDEETPPSTAGAAGAEPVERELEIAPNSRRRLALSELVTGPVASAVVEAPRGGLVVEHEVSSVHGTDSKPCATAAADTWHFAWGTTERAARQLLVLFNPFPDDAIIDGRFSTDEGVREPVRWDGLVVPARSTMAVDLGDDVTRRAEVAATITARTGRIVVDRVLRINVPDGPRGLTVQLGVPHAQPTWMYPDGFTSDDISELFVVYNPGEEVAEVEIAVSLERPDEHGIPEPFDLSLPPGTHATVDVGADGRVPAGVAHSTIVRAANDVPIVSERVLVSTGAARPGFSVTTGSPVLAETWTFAAGATGPADDQWLVILNPDPRVLTEVRVTAVVGGQRVPVSELQDLVLEAGERIALRLGERIQRDDLAVEVAATEPVVVERGRYEVGEDDRGISSAIGVPSADGLSRLGDPLDIDVEADLGDDLDTDTEADDAPPAAPDDVELPEPDETIVVGDPDAEADVPGSTTTTPEGDAPEDGEGTSTTGVPDTTP